MADYRKVQVKKFPTQVGQLSQEAKYWKKFRSPVLVKEYASITSIQFSPTRPHDFAVTSSTRVQIYSPATHAVRKTISRFKDVAYSGNIRNDGKLLVAGDAAGVVQIFDMNSRAILRTMTGHKDAVRVAKFSPNHTQILSASDDRTVRVWDVPTETPIVVYSDHEDHVRAACVSEDNPHLIFSGSYDQTVKLWDLRAPGCMMTLQHGAPVESLLCLPGASMIASAGSNKLKIWNILDGGSLFQTLSNHTKTITTTCLDGSRTRILTGSLDQQVKIYSLQDYKVVHSIKYPAPILSMDISPDDTHLAVGMSTGLLAIRQRIVKTEDIAKAQRKSETLRGGTFKFFTRGSSHKPDMSSDIRIESHKKKRLKPYDKFLKSFSYSKALDAVLQSQQRNPLVVVSLLEELIHRDGLKIALGGRDDIALEPIARFLVKHINNGRYAPVLIQTSNAVLDMYGPVIGQSIIIDELFIKLRRKIQSELDVQERFMETIGLLESLMIASQRK
ncbi:snoRNA-binding rRNA-processing protein [Chytridiales sp. JEL 0842]|nr:snoRNA-binding rRNA-processing protein [Chytridiales sp. JEL 0842]